MNNRPLFWAVMCFALGEVLYIIADRGNQIGTAFVVLICIVFLLSRIKLPKKKMIIYIGLLFFGGIRAWWADYTYMGNVLFGCGKYVEVRTEYDDYQIYSRGVVGESVGSRSSVCYKEFVAGYGVVDNIEEGSSGYNLTIRIKQSNIRGEEFFRDYKVIVYGVDKEYFIGDIVELSGDVMDFVPDGNPGEFDRRVYYKARGIVGYSNKDSMRINPLAMDKQIPWYEIKHKLWLLRQKISENLNIICQEKTASVYSGILLGDKSGIPEVDMLLFRMCGIAHIFAISGVLNHVFGYFDSA